ncbi:hypothetical protein ARMSODRAFT_1078111 [Armillaria solidipes]|uniref:Uncharacterized protein n=1 Tax=Armillaria solidipes TaxID=1076256 RepID=A0A2H3C9M2_9AGAR|nr:hypothetical protein ARMSODRAFT_1078111 [Armillaria solidipes]
MATNSRSSKHKRPLDSELKDSSISPTEMSIDGGLPSSVKCRKTGSVNSSPKSQRSQSRKSSSKQNPPKVTQKDLAKAKSAQKAQRKQAWNTWLAREENRWSPEEDPNYKQEVGWQVIHYSDANKYYRFSDVEMETLPYTTFDNKHDLNHPGRSFHRLDLLRLGYRKAAVLGGIPGALEGIFQGEALQEGKRLYDEKMKDLDDKYKKKHEGKSRPGPETYTIFEKKGTTGRPRPPGSWWERVYENGKKIGHWLVLRFDPDADEGPSPPHPNREERFWPLENGYPNW